MKKTLAAFLCLCYLMLAGIVPALAMARETGYYYVNTNDNYGLKLRSSPYKMSNDENLIVKLPHRSNVLIYQFDDYGNWAYVEAQNPRGTGTVKGWCMSSYLVINDPGPVRQSDDPSHDDNSEFLTLNSEAKKIRYLDEPYYAYIITKNPNNFVHLRWFPSTNANFIAQYLCNTEVEVLAESSRWCQVRMVEDGYVGFILKANVNPMIIIERR